VYESFKKVDPLGKTRWGWREVEGDEVFGPYDTRELAIAEASLYLSPEQPTPIVVGNCLYANPENYIVDEIDYILVYMEDKAMQEGSFGHVEDELFYAADKEEAAADLTSMMKEWSKKHILSSSWILSNEETVDVPIPIK
jgi:hypothetical protein